MHVEKEEMTFHGRRRKEIKNFLDVSNIRIHYNFFMFTLGLLGLFFAVLEYKLKDISGLGCLPDYC